MGQTHSLSFETSSYDFTKSLSRKGAFPYSAVEIPPEHSPSNNKYYAISIISSWQNAIFYWWNFLACFTVSTGSLSPKLIPQKWCEIRGNDYFALINSFWFFTSGVSLHTLVVNIGGNEKPLRGIDLKANNWRSNHGRVFLGRLPKSCALFLTNWNDERRKSY